MDNAYLIELRSEISILAAFEWVYHHPEAARASAVRACAYVRRELSIRKIIPRFRRAVRRNRMSVKVSVVVPARDEQATIRALLDSLLRTNLPGGGDHCRRRRIADRTAEIVREYRARFTSVPVRLLTPAQHFPESPAMPVWTRRFSIILRLPMPASS